jgi:hypothetical protein
MIADTLRLSFVDLRLHVHVNDVDLVATAGVAGARPFELLLPVNRLAADDEPHTVYLARCPACDDDECGRMIVGISRDGDFVHWDWGKRAPLMSRRATFLAAQYDAEIARATNDSSWETPHYTAVRKVLTDTDHAHLSRWDLTFDYFNEQRPGDDFQVCLIGGGYQVFLDFPWQGRGPDALAAEVCATLALSPRQWNATWFPNRWELRDSPPPFAGPDWRRVDA